MLGVPSDEMLHIREKSGFSFFCHSVTAMHIQIEANGLKLSIVRAHILSHGHNVLFFYEFAIRKQLEVAGHKVSNNVIDMRVALSRYLH